jgi:RNA polymerase sigma-70 factor (ECF subfamily)
MIAFAYPPFHPAIRALPGLAGGLRLSEAAELMSRIARRDERALETLYDRYSKVLYAAMVCIVKSRDDAEELLCDVFQQVWDRAQSYDPMRGAVYTWLLRMARNRAIDRIRSRDHKNRALEADIGGDDPGDMDLFAGSSADNALDGIVLSERAAAVRAAFAGISAEQRAVLEAAYFEGRTQSQIAARDGLPLGTVKTRMRDGMIALRGLLKEKVEWP